jgi:diguanylate cyclase (GGDEF)-like protein
MASASFAAKPGRAAWFRLQHALRNGRDLRVLLPVLCCALVILTWTAAFRRLTDEHHAAVTEALARTDSLASAFEQFTIRNIHTYDQIANFVKYEYESHPGDVSLAATVSRALVGQSTVILVSVADERGQVIASTQPIPSGTSIADRPHFAVHNGDDDDNRLYISAPVIGRVSKQPSLQISRRLNHSDGSFAGVVVVSLQTTALTDFYGSLRLHRSASLALLGNDGVFRAHVGGADGVLEGGIDAASYRAQIEAARAGHRALAIDGDSTRRFLGVRQLDDYPFVVSVGEAEHDALANYERSRSLYLALAAGVTALLVLSFGFAGSLAGQLQRNEAKLAKLAHFDPLTGLPNRHTCQEELAQLLSRGSESTAILFLDLDDFKHVNDTLGHAFGDLLLVKAARMLAGCVRATDRIYRFGGDEFIIVLSPLANDGAAAAICEQILAAFAVPVALGGRQIRSGASIGVSICPRDGADVSTALRNADLAMYSAKANGKRSYAFFSPALGEAADQRLLLEAEMHRGLARGEFDLAYQPTVSAATGAVLGFEALMRWNAPARGPIPPAAFIPLAEANGFIVDLGRFALDRACAQIKSWQRDGLGWIRVAVNVSAEQFRRSDLFEDVRNALDRHGVPPRALGLELTESLLMSDPEAARAVLEQLRRLGVSVAVDDFGVGFSSLTSLRQFKADTLKLDRSFLRDVAADSASSKIVQSIVGLAHGLGMIVVAEGVESPLQHAFLTAAHCDVLQGFLFSPAVGAAHVPSLVTRVFVRADPGGQVSRCRIDVRQGET